MKPDNFASFHRRRCEALRYRIHHATAQTEAARELLATAEARGLKTDYWVEALAFAEGAEADARKALAAFEARDFAVIVARTNVPKSCEREHSFICAKWSGQNLLKSFCLSVFCMFDFIPLGYMFLC